MSSTSNLRELIGGTLRELSDVRDEGRDLAKRLEEQERANNEEWFAIFDAVDGWARQVRSDDARHIVRDLQALLTGVFARHEVIEFSPVLCAVPRLDEIEALDVAHDSQLPELAVARVLRRGFMKGDRILR